MPRVRNKSSSQNPYQEYGDTGSFLYRTYFFAVFCGRSAGDFEAHTMWLEVPITPAPPLEPLFLLIFVVDAKCNVLGIYTVVTITRGHTYVYLFSWSYGFVLLSRECRLAPICCCVHGCVCCKGKVFYTLDAACVVDRRQVGAVNRRMVGHGNLAERSVLPVMPDTETFPYTTRVSAEV